MTRDVVQAIEANPLGPVAGALAGAWVYERIRCGGEPRMANGCC